MLLHPILHHLLLGGPVRFVLDFIDQLTIPVRLEVRLGIAISILALDVLSFESIYLIHMYIEVILLKTVIIFLLSWIAVMIHNTHYFLGRSFDSRIKFSYVFELIDLSV
jgi:hypothetical protein